MYESYIFQRVFLYRSQRKSWIFVSATPLKPLHGIYETVGIKAQCVDVHLTMKFRFHYFSRNFSPFELRIEYTDSSEQFLNTTPRLIRSTEFHESL